MEKSYNIDLQTYRTQGSKVFTGRPRGLDVRNRSQIDIIEEEYDRISITIPPDISSINPSFLEEFLEHVVLKLGENGFYKKFSFINEGKYKITEDLTEAIERVLRTESAID